MKKKDSEGKKKRKKKKITEMKNEGKKEKNR